MNKIHPFTNLLINETSPYLLQHAHNPVNWHAWNTETLQKAANENKPILVSIGYAACHWCHVMEHESFENEEIANLMNSHFICIKVDREERPDVDAVYMNAVQLLTGSGGWPLNCFALPNGKPFYGGTYFKPAMWMHVLKSLAEMYANNKARILQASEEILKGINQLDIIKLADADINENTDLIFQLKESILANLDFEEGGLSGAPKFPMPGLHAALLTYSHLFNCEKTDRYLATYLEKIAQGGMYDHVAGGFARYSVDNEWVVPHFEKMLYDNVQLISLYSKAYMVQPKADYTQIAEKTIQFIETELQSPEGIFYSSLDADSEGEEGKYYVWEYTEFEQLAGSDSSLFIEYFNVEKNGNWEGLHNILHCTQNESEFREKHALTDSNFQLKKEKLLKKLYEVRKNRLRPGLDDKSITAWNSLCISAYTNAYWAFGNPEYLAKAKKIADFITRNLISENATLYRNYKAGKTTIPAFSDDYAATVEAFLNLYSVSFDLQYLYTAKRLTETLFANFFDENSGFFWFTSKTDEPLFTRKAELTDQVIPSSNALIAKSLLQLSELFSNQTYIETAQTMLNNMQGQIKRMPAFHYKWFETLTEKIKGYKLLVICGKDAHSFLEALQGIHMPNLLIAGATEEPEQPIAAFKNRFVDGETIAYICENNTCSLPINSVEELLNRLKKN